MTGRWSRLALRSLGPAGDVGPIGFGCWRLVGDDATNIAAVETALECGFTLVDNAAVYGLDWGGSGFGACEEALGRVLAARPSLRAKMVLATKAGIVPGVPYDSSPEHLVASCEASLRRMGVDHVDLFQIHRPDHWTHPLAIAEAFDDLHRRGLARAFGVSNHSVHQTEALADVLDVPFVSVQPEFSAAHLDPMRDGTLDQCLRLGLVPLAWSPLSGGRLATGDSVRPELLTVLDELASREGASRSAVAVAFVLAHPTSPVALVGTQQPARLLEIAAALRVDLSREDLYRIVEASDGTPLP